MRSVILFRFLSLELRLCREVSCCQLQLCSQEPASASAEQRNQQLGNEPVLKNLKKHIGMDLKGLLLACCKCILEECLHTVVINFCKSEKIFLDATLVSFGKKQT